MLDGLVDSSAQIGLRMNLDKTKVNNEHVTPEPIVVNSGDLEVVRESLQSVRLTGYDLRS